MAPSEKSPAKILPELVLVLPETPSLNQMINLAKERTHQTKHGGWSRVARPVVYDQHKTAYETAVQAILRQAGVWPPLTPWPRWRLVSAEFRLHNLRDPLELLAGLKWAVDALVAAGYVTNDSPRELASVPLPTQRIDRKNRGVTMVIAPVPDA